MNRRTRNAGGRTRRPEETRRRIVEATVALHEEVGPLATTISAIAERAGVQRLTVYRHFPDERSLFRACSSHWAAEHPFPDPAGWAGLPDPEARLRAALTELYGFYRSESRMIDRILRDEADVPVLAEVNEPLHEYLREQAGSLSAGWGVGAESQRQLRAAVGHAVGFRTWQSLSFQGLVDEESVELLARFVAGIADRGRSTAAERVVGNAD